MLDITAIRQDFPILKREVHGRPLVYLDNAATTQKPQVVIDALVDYYTNHNANIHRGLHVLAEEATDMYERTRVKAARFINAPDSHEIVFTRNTTESINLVAHGWGRKFIQAGDEIVLTGMEHHSNLVPWQMLAQATGARLVFLSVSDEGTLDLDEARQKINSRTKLVSVVHMSNVLGTINPVEALAELAHANNALMLVDAAQSVPHMPVDVQQLGCDFLAFSAHKMAGPTGVGVLWARADILEAMDPFLGGGDMIRIVKLEESTWNDIPYKFEAGTPNIADVVAFGSAFDYLSALGMDAVREHEIALTRYALDRMSVLDDMTIYGPRDAEARGGVVAFNFGDIHPHDLGQVLDSYGIAVRAGHHCAQPLMRRYDVAATARASFYIYNEEREVDALIEGLHSAAEFFGHVSRAAV
jgi:cysteine desulfurase/selenocysteine lyase